MLMNLMMTSVMGKISWIFLLLVTFFSQAKTPPEAPKNYRWVQDEVGLLSEEQEVYLLKKLKKHYDSTSTEIAIVIEKSLEGDDVFRYTQALAQKWGIGTEGNDNGVLIYIAFENDDPNKRKIWIQVGYGLEGAIPDIYANRIVRQVMAPKFKEKKYGEGLNDALDVIIGLAAGEFEFDKDEKAKGIPIGGIVIIVIVLIILFSRNNNGGNTYRTRGMGTGPIWTTGGFGAGGSFGGGGFGGGFGGGSFGGGGAGGSW
jgi:uncharacterized protein